MLFEHFLYAEMGDGIRILKSKGVTQLLPTERLYALYHIGDNVKEETTFQQWFPAERVLAISYIRPVFDDMDRKSVWNHTILVKPDQYFQLTQPAEIFKPYFLKELAKPLPRYLEALKVGEQ